MARVAMGAPVERKVMNQWFFRITAFAQSLDSIETDLNRWPDKVRTMQSNWIGKSQGASHLGFRDRADQLTIYTTRSDTLFGPALWAYLGHPLAKELAQTNEEIAAFIKRVEALHIRSRN